MMITVYIILGILVIGTIVYLLPKKKKKNIDSDLKKIDTFNEGEYIKDHFKDIFKSLLGVKSIKDNYRVPSETNLDSFEEDKWYYCIDYYEIKFHKVISFEGRDSSFNRINQKGVSNLTFRYDFNDKKEFEVSGCELELPNNMPELSWGDRNLKYNSDFDEEIIQFLYEKYKWWKDITNKNIKEKADKKLEGMKLVLGKRSNRKNKIDKLIN